MRTRCGSGLERAHAITHWQPPEPPVVSNSTGKSCCSVEVASEGAKRVKKESISAGLGGCLGNSRNGGSGVKEVVG